MTEKRNHTEKLNAVEKRLLLDIARDAIYSVAAGKETPVIQLADLTENLRRKGASFVTLTISGKLRGCIGSLEATQPLALDVQEHAVAAATQDFRFPPISLNEVPLLEIEISRLTPTQKLEYENPHDLVAKLRPGKDGVVIRDGFRRATFLPQVWEKLPAPEEFLNHLCIKMGAEPNLWRTKDLEIFTYQVEEFKEEAFDESR